MRLSSLLEKRSEGRKPAKEEEDLNSSLTLQQKGFAQGCSNDELIVFGDHDNEQDESSLLNSNLLKLLDEDKTPRKTPRVEQSHVSPISKRGAEDHSKFLISKAEVKGEPIRVFRTNRETNTLKDLGGPLKESDFRLDSHPTPKSSTGVEVAKKKSKLSRQASKESISSKKSGRSIRSRKQSKDSGVINDPPLKKTLASVMGKMSTPTLDKASPQSILSNPLENSPMFNNKTIRELKLAEKTSPSNLKPSFVNLQPSRPHISGSSQPGGFHLAIEKVQIPDRSPETTNRIAHIMQALKKPLPCDSKDLLDTDFDSERMTRDTPTSKHGLSQHLLQKDIFQSEDTSSFSSHLHKPVNLLSESKTGMTPTKSRTPRVEGYRPFTLSSVLAKKDQTNEN